MLTALIVLIFLSILVLVHEFGHFIAAKRFGLFVEEFGIGLPPRIYGKKIGETIYSINALPIGGFVKIAGENGEEDADKKIPSERVFFNLKIWRRIIIIIAGVTMNFILGWVLISVIFAVGVPQAVFITQVQSNTPAAQAGVQVNDKIVGFTSVDDLINYINQNKGKQIDLKVERNGEKLDFKMTPRTNPPPGEGSLGIGMVQSGQQKESVLKSVWDGLKSAGQMFSIIFVGIFTLIKLAILGRSPLQNITGPVGIVKLTAQFSHLGLIYLTQLLALISVNLAAINIFPFPALDGGRLLFLIIEKIKGSPLPKKFESYANAVGMALLLLLIAIITYKDITRLF